MKRTIILTVVAVALALGVGTAMTVTPQAAIIFFPIVLTIPIWLIDVAEVILKGSKPADL